MARTAPPAEQTSRQATEVLPSPTAPPHNDEAEQAMLGGLMLAAHHNERALLDAYVPAFPREAFYHRRHQAIWAAMAAVHAAGDLPDPITVTDHLRVAGMLDEAGGARYITQLVDAVFSPVIVHQYAAIVLRDYKARVAGDMYAQQAHEILDGGRTDLEAHFALTERVIAGLRETGFDSPPYREGSLPNRIQTAPELLQALAQEQAWWVLWGQIGFLGPGLATLISGHGKVAGKSTSVSIGIRDLMQARPHLRVLVLSEEPRSLWTRRMAAWDFAPPGLSLRFADGTPWTALLREMERADAQVVVIDTLRAFAGIVDENDASKVTEAVQPLILLARRTNAGVIATHHLRKSEGEEGLAHSGSTALVGLFDVTIEMRLTKDHAPNRRNLDARSRFDETPRALAIELRGHQIVPLGTPDEVTLNEVAARVLEMLPVLDQTGMTRDDVRNALDDPKPSPEQVSRALRLLHNEDKATRQGKGVRGDPQRWWRASQ